MLKFLHIQKTFTTFAKQMKKDNKKNIHYGQEDNFNMVV